MASSEERREDYERYSRAVTQLMRGSGWPRRDVERDPESAWWAATNRDVTLGPALADARRVVLEGKP